MRALLLLVAALLAAPALGEEDGARRAFAEGAALQRAGAFEAAIDAYRRGHAHTPRPAFLFNIAQCERALGRTEDAIKTYRNYLRAAPDAANAADVHLVLAQLAEELASRPPPEPLAEAPTSALYERWWFWAAVAVVAVGGGSAAYAIADTGPAVPSPSLGEVRW